MFTYGNLHFLSDTTVLLGGSAHNDVIKSQIDISIKGALPYAYICFDGKTCWGERLFTMVRVLPILQYK